jgi:8-oxo-dGTP pyrophosphatase MutT (NUDIX family)
MDFHIPREVMLPVEHIDVALDPAPHPFETANLAAIDLNWERELNANPALFDGRVSLFGRLGYRDRRLEGSTHLVRFATFMYWRKVRPVPSTGHCFAYTMLVTSDGALVAIRMGPRTANPGRVYFASGSFEREDFPLSRLDVDLNMAREVMEETGLDISGLPRDPVRHIWSAATATAIVRRYRLPMTAIEAEASIRAFVAKEEDPEIEGPVVIRSVDGLPPQAGLYMSDLAAWHFGGSEAGAA